MASKKTNTGKPKKPYARPKLEGTSVLEAGSALCCKATNATCSNDNKTWGGKGQRTRTSS